MEEPPRRVEPGHQPGTAVRLPRPRWLCLLAFRYSLGSGGREAFEARLAHEHDDTQMQLVTAPRRRTLALAGVALMLAASLGGCVSNAASRGQIDLVAMFTTGSPDPGWPYLDATDRTRSTCGPVTNCVQAVGSEYVTVLKFASVEDAARYAATLGSRAVQIDPLVVDFNGKLLTAAQRSDVVKALSGINADSPD